MTIPSKKTVVVDADVLSGASTVASSNSHGARCRRILNLLHDVCHSVIVSNEKEWNLTSSAHAVFWKAAMTLKGKVDKETVPQQTSLRMAVTSEIKQKSYFDAMMKDIHLIEAAAFRGGVIFSNNKKDRKKFMESQSIHAHIPSVVWIAPDEITGDIEQWIRDGMDENHVLFQDGPIKIAR